MLTFLEKARAVRSLVPESVRELEVVELLGQQTGEGGTHHGPGQRFLAQSPSEQVDVIHVPESSQQEERHCQCRKEIGASRLWCMDTVYE